MSNMEKEGPSSEEQRTSSIEHLSAGGIERFAINPETLHLASCQDCQNRTLHYAETRAAVPLEQYPPAE